MGVRNIMSIVKSRKNTPAAVHLRIVPVDFRNQQEDWRQEQRERKGGYEGIRSQIDVTELGGIVVGLEKLLWEIVELRDIWEDCLVEVGAVDDGFHDWKSHD